MTATTENPSGTARQTNLNFVWLEITGKCQLECIHCYADSGPQGSHGVMDTTDWLRVIDECSGLGVEMVQFIGGEPTLHPDLPRLVEHALGQGLEVEIFSNLVHVSDRMWDTFNRPGVRLACSWYSDDPKQHLLITKRNTHARTKANIAEALRREIPLRAGIIGMLDDQNVQAATAELEALGVVEVGVDHLRQVGRGVRDRDATVAELCGNCGDGVLAIGPDGAIWPCVFTRWMPVGNVQDSSIAEVLAGQALAQRTAELQDAFGAQPSGCNPNCNPTCAPHRCEPTCAPSCTPASCNPTCSPKCGPSCSPCAPDGRCWPYFQ
jgi:MoaA/NifB/PqqE/SkfB family radical SAM enzyme